MCFLSLACVVVCFAVIFSGVSASEAGVATEPQFFCGSCHILTYPEMIQQGYELWKKSKHKDVGCVQCHYPGNTPHGLGASAPAGSGLGITFIPKVPPERFAYVRLGGRTVQTRAHIEDSSCMATDCHGKPGDDFKTRKIEFSERKVNFIHQPHFEKKNRIDGQKLNCTSCHQHETDQKKFEVSKDICLLCHFMGSKVNDGRGRCEICHELPKEPIEASGLADEDTGERPADLKPITHAMLKKAKVSCASCHFGLVQAQSGATYEAFFTEEGVLETALVYGAGRIKQENCRTCHDQEKDIERALEMKLMHERHVTVKNARCFDCHRTITHKKADLEERTPQDDDPVLLSGCMTCHPETHFYQRALTSGMRNPADDPVPDPMYQARVNCLACHVEMTTKANGENVLKASANACVGCHDKNYKKTLSEWKTELAEKLKAALKTERETLQVLKKVRKQFAATESEDLEEALDEADENLEEPMQNLKIVRFGNGVHNKEYAIMLLDEAIEYFDEVKEVLESAQEAAASE